MTEHVTAHLLDPLREAPAVHRLQRERLQNQQLQRTLQQSTVTGTIGHRRAAFRLSEGIDAEARSNSQVQKHGGRTHKGVGAGAVTPDSLKSLLNDYLEGGVEVSF